MTELKTKTLRQVKSFVKWKIHLFREKNITNDFTILYDRLFKKQYWSEQEEHLLKKAYAVYGPNFKDIQKLVAPTRTVDAVKRHFNDMNQGKFCNKPVRDAKALVQSNYKHWSEEEEQKLLKLIEKHGHNYKMFTSFFERNYDSICKKVARLKIKYERV